MRTDGHNEANSRLQFCERAYKLADRDSVVGKANRYGRDGPRIELQWKRDFLDSLIPVPRPSQRPVQWVLGVFPRGTAAGM